MLCNLCKNITIIIINSNSQRATKITYKHIYHNHNEIRDSPVCIITMGRDRDELVDGENISEEFNCAICSEVLDVNAVITPCEHLFCEDELLSWFMQSKTATQHCPLCNVEIDPNAVKKPCRTIRNLLKEIEQYCPNRSEGCTWQGTADDLANHLENCTCDNDTSNSKKSNNNKKNEKKKSQKQNDDFQRASMDELCLMVLEKEKEIEKLASLNKKLKSRIRDLNKKVESLETSLLGTDAMKTYKKAEKDVQSYLRPTKSSGRKEKVVVYSKK